MNRMNSRKTRGLYYTGNGDSGFSFTLKRRLRKSSDLMEAIGDIDELQAFLGYAENKTKEDRVRSLIRDIIHDLYMLNAELAGFKKDTFSPDRTKKLERLINSYAKRIKPLYSFTYPIGVESAVILNICRTIARRAERRIVKVCDNKSILSYINRLSSLLYVLYRYENERHHLEYGVLKFK
ncbi:MAG: cob(I)yrinic acid a,c-diamide adenosyltransferase [Candidatus Parvarchaeota archaeon]|nr:cob(I)yrinic acid a,c-diamide adenosyltransferase [Candidatus Parvarchaeota archaeon]